MDRATVYILRCADGSFYTGITRRDVEQRVGEHNAGLTKAYTLPRRPVSLLHAESYDRLDEAIAAERRIKGWSRAKKVAYIRGDFESLRAVARPKSAGSGADPSSFDTGAAHPAQDEGSFAEPLTADVSPT